MNYSVFERNVMHSLDGVSRTPFVHELSCVAFMRGGSENAALEIAQVASFVEPLIRSRLDETSADNLIQFIAERAYRRHFPGN